MLSHQLEETHQHRDEHVEKQEGAGADDNHKDSNGGNDTRRVMHGPEDRGPATHRDEAHVGYKSRPRSREVRVHSMKRNTHIFACKSFKA